ncbi:MAG TPA: gamma carbonic anhydrase family protein [Candidatus Deferrimicrobiaceae bacterium]|jgi:carbonic anhydrase/acetyltransferase-like protein (isoleucine patch superfamily)|nr:gamma carbonic anhydrase family protein [Candidatus Deferrimicrobiaceae bacterium]
MLIGYHGIVPKCHASVFVAEGAMVIGDVEIGEDSSVWFHTVIRGDIHRIRIGKRTNVQDHCTLHVTRKEPLVAGDGITIGHGAVVHGCTVEDLCLVGIGAVVLDGAVIGRGSVIGAGAVVSPGTIVPPHSLVLGIPGKVVKDLGPGSADGNRVTAESYVELARGYRKR